jgi:hypothetical protein
VAPHDPQTDPSWPTPTDPSRPTPTDPS